MSTAVPVAQRLKRCLVRLATVDQSTLGASVLLFSGGTIATLLNAATGLYLARTLAVVAYGRLAYFFSLYLLLSLLIGLGLTTRLVTTLSKLHSVGLMAGVGGSFYSQLAVRLVTAGSVAVLAGGVSIAAGDVLYVLVGSAAAVSITNDFILGVAQALRRGWRLFLGLLIQPISYAVLLVGGLSQSANGALAAFGISCAVAACANAAMLRGTGVGFPKASVLDRTIMFGSLGFLTQVYIVTLLQSTYGQGAIALLGVTGNLRDTAQLSVSLTLCRFLPVALASTAQAVYYPRLAASIARGDTHASRSLFSRFGLACALVGLAATVTIACFPRTSVEAFYSHQYGAAASVVALVSPLSTLIGLESLVILTMIALDLGQWLVFALGARLVALGLMTGAAVAIGTSELVYVVGAGYVLTTLAFVTAGLHVLSFRFGFRLPRQKISRFALALALVALVAKLLFPDSARVDLLFVLRLAFLAATMGGVLSLAIVNRVAKPWHQWVLGLVSLTEGRN